VNVSYNNRLQILIINWTIEIVCMLINQRLDKTKIGKYKLMMLMMLKLMKMNNKNKVILLIKIGAPIQILVDKQIKN